MGEGEEDSVELVVAGGDAAEALELAEEPFDLIAALVERAVVGLGLAAGCASAATGFQPSEAARPRVAASSQARSISRAGPSLPWLRRSSSSHLAGASGAGPSESPIVSAPRSSRANRCRLVVQPPCERPIACGPLFSALPPHPGAA